MRTCHHSQLPTTVTASSSTADIRHEQVSTNRVGRVTAPQSVERASQASPLHRPRQHGLERALAWPQARNGVPRTPTPRSSSRRCFRPPDHAHQRSRLRTQHAGISHLRPATAMPRAPAVPSAGPSPRELSLVRDAVSFRAARNCGHTMVRREDAACGPGHSRNGFPPTSPHRHAEPPPAGDSLVADWVVRCGDCSLLQYDYRFKVRERLRAAEKKMQRCGHPSSFVIRALSLEQPQRSHVDRCQSWVTLHRGQLNQSPPLVNTGQG